MNMRKRGNKCRWVLCGSLFFYTYSTGSAYTMTEPPSTVFGSTWLMCFQNETDARNRKRYFYIEYARSFKTSALWEQLPVQLDSMTNLLRRRDIRQRCTFYWPYRLDELLIRLNTQFVESAANASTSGEAY